MVIKVSILGLGNMGRNHLRVLSMLKGADIAYVYDVNPDTLQALSAQYNVPYTDDPITAIEAADAVVIVTPTTTHFDYFKMCAGRVKNVFIEKPLAETLEQAQEIKQLAEQHGMFIQCGFIERFNPVVVELKRVLETDTVINADFTRTNRLSARITDVDVVLDLMIHDIDLALFLNGPIKSILAHGKKEHGLVAFASAIAVHENGALSRILASRMTEKKIRSIQVTSSNAYIDAELVRRELVLHKQSSISQEDCQQYVVSSLEQQIEVKNQEALLSQHQSFLAACHGELARELPTLYSGIESLRISQIILEQIS